MTLLQMLQAHPGEIVIRRSEWNPAYTLKIPGRYDCYPVGSGQIFVLEDGEPLEDAIMFSREDLEGDDWVFPALDNKEVGG